MATVHRNDPVKTEGRSETEAAVLHNHFIRTQVSFSVFVWENGVDLDGEWG